MASTLMTAGILLGITFVFIFLFLILHKRGKQKALANQNATFEKLVRQHNLKVDQKEQFNYYVIALDTSKAKLLYINHSNSEEEVKVIDLQEIKSVKVDFEENSIYENSKGKSILVEKHLLLLQLVLTRKDTNQPAEHLPFYQYKDGVGDFSMLKNRIESWRNNINNFIKVR